MQSNDNIKNRGAHGNSSFMLGGLPSSSENPPASAVGSVNETVYRDVVLAVINAYIEVMGRDAWNSKTTQEQHDVIMTAVKDALKALESIETNERKETK